MLADPFLAASAVDVIAMSGEWAVSSHPQLRAIVDAVAEHRVRETISRIQDSRFDARDLQRLGKFVKHIGTHIARQYRNFNELNRACILQWEEEKLESILSPRSQIPNVPAPGRAIRHKTPTEKVIQAQENG
jgi:hypothetical protein